MIKVYYDNESSNIIIGDKLTGRSGGAMVAEPFSTINKVGIKYKNSAIYEAVLKPEDIRDFNNNSVGANITEVINYVNEELNKTNSVENTGILERNVSLSGTEQTISLAGLALTKMFSYNVKNTLTNREVSVVLINNGSNIVVQSNQDLTGHTITIIGV